ELWRSFVLMWCYSFLSRFGSFFFFFFFFQAEDGIRDATVTGVQTCALPILQINENQSSIRDSVHRNLCTRRQCPSSEEVETVQRSEERRVGKECRSRWGEEQSKKKGHRGRDRRITDDNELNMSSESMITPHV